MKKRSGFTLIELLAVIVILAIIALIAAPVILNIINDVKKQSFVNSSYGIVSAAKNGFASKLLKEPATETIYTYSNGSETKEKGNIDLKYDGTVPQYGKIVISDNGEVAIALYKDGICVTKKYDESKVTSSKVNKDDCVLLDDEAPLVYQDTTGASVPVLESGMIPIRWDGSKWVKADITQEWYNYANKEWANVVLVTESSRSTYKSASAGTAINETDVLAYLVWIPRYKYKLFNVEFLSVPVQTIEIVFESKTTPKSTGSTNGTYLTHPAFTFGSDELSGIWVGKFETTGDATTPTVKPSIASLRSQNISTQFTTAQKFKSATYGLNTGDTHMMKNIEWGAVTYLTQSIYGKNSEVWINPSSDYITGCAGTSVSASGSSGCSYYYTSSNGIEASTTGNVTGIYDMSGGAFEYVMGVMLNSDNLTISEPFFSGFAQETIDSADMSKYIDKYIYGTTFKDQTAYNRSKLGDATGETRGWNSDGSFFVDTDCNWFLRGDFWPDGASAGVFAFEMDSGNAGNPYSFRVVFAE